MFHGCALSLLKFGAIMVEFWIIDCLKVCGSCSRSSFAGKVVLYGRLASLSSYNLYG